MIYEIIKQVDYAGNSSHILKRTNDDGSVSWIPMDESNADYKFYLDSQLENGTIS